MIYRGYTESFEKKSAFDIQINFLSLRRIAQSIVFNLNKGLMPVLFKGSKRVISCGSTSDCTIFQFHDDLRKTHHITDQVKHSL